jgi:hypothetical protein
VMWRGSMAGEEVPALWPLCHADAAEGDGREHGGRLGGGLSGARGEGGGGGGGGG